MTHTTTSLHPPAQAADARPAKVLRLQSDAGITELAAILHTDQVGGVMARSPPHFRTFGGQVRPPFLSLTVTKTVKVVHTVGANMLAVAMTAACATMEERGLGREGHGTTLSPLGRAGGRRRRTKPARLSNQETSRRSTMRAKVWA